MENKIPYSELTFEFLNKKHKINNFDCGDEDLNNFLKNQALNDLQAGASITYIIKYQDEIVAYFTIINDSVEIFGQDKCLLIKKETHRELRKKGKPYRSLPAVKIARKAVIKEFQKRGIGTNMLKRICGLYVPPIPTGGAVFITADVYPQAKGFYGNLGFEEFNFAIRYSTSDNIPMLTLLDNLVENLFPESE